MIFVIIRITKIHPKRGADFPVFDCLYNLDYPIYRYHLRNHVSSYLKKWPRFRYCSKKKLSGKLKGPMTFQLCHRYTVIFEKKDYD